MSAPDDGGLQWWAQVGQWQEEQEREAAWQEALRINELLEAHRQWVQEFHEQSCRMD